MDAKPHMQEKHTHGACCSCSVGREVSKDATFPPIPWPWCNISLLFSVLESNMAQFHSILSEA